MIANVSKTNNGKLLAAIAIFAMLVCAFAIAMPSVNAADGEEGGETTPAQTSLPQAVDGVITLTGDVVLSQNMTITDRIVVGDYALTIKGDLIVNYTFTEVLQHVFTIGATGSIIIDGGSLTVNANNGSDFKPVEGQGNIVFSKTTGTEYPTDGNIVVKSGSLTVTEGSDVNGQMASGNIMFVIETGTVKFNGNGIGAAYFVQNGGSVDFNSNNGRLQPYYDLNAGTLTVAGNNGDNAIFTPYAMDIAAGATLNVNGPMDMYNGDTDTVPTNVSSELTMKTVENLGTINVGTSGSISIPAGASLTGTGVVNSASDIEQTISDADKVADAIANPNVDSIIYNGATAPAVENLNKPMTITNASAIPKTGSIVKGGSLTIDTGSDITIGSDGLEVTQDKNSVKLSSGFTAESIVFYYGSAGIEVVKASGTLEITGDGKIHGTIDGDMTITQKDGANLVADDDIEIATNDIELIVDSGVVLDVGSFLKFGENVSKFTLTVRPGATLVYSELPAGTTLNNLPGSIIKIEGGQGTENIISTDMTVSGDMYLSQETTIMEGVTVTVTRNSTLHLMSFELINNGTIVVDKGGKIVSDNDGSIVLMATGSIENNGTIGGDKPVTVYNGTKTDSTGYTQSVSILGVDGIKFTMERDRTANDRNQYDMSVSGDIGRVSGVTTGELILKNVDIDADMTIKSNVELVIEGTTEVAKDVTFTNNGNLMTITDGTGEFVLTYGASIVINSPVSGTITAVVGQVGENNAVNGTQTVTFAGKHVDASGDVKAYYAGVTGITISVDRVNEYNEKTDKTDVDQRMYVTGALDYQTQEKNTTNYNTVVFSDKDKVYVIDTLTIPKDVAVSGGMFMVSEGGSVVDVTDGTESALNYNGAKYSVESEDTTSDEVTYYYVDFATAMANIAGADDMTIILAGEYEITGTYTLAADQAIEAATGSKVVVDDGASITVEVDADVQDTAFYQILGKVLVKEGVGYTPKATNADDVYVYAVKTVDSETNDTTYSGFGVAMDEAQSGQTITVVGSAEYDGNLVIPEGVTVDVQEDLDLSVLGNVTVNGKLVLDNNADLIVGKVADRDYTVTVNGELDASEGGYIKAFNDAADVSKFANVDVFSTGTLSIMSKIGDANVTANAAYYFDDCYVYTTLANAVAYAEANALPSVNATGTFSETGAVESDDVDIIIDTGSNVTLGDLTLNAAKISVTGTGVYTAAVSGFSGAGDAAVTSTVSVSKTDATIENKVTLNAEGVNQYVLTISGLTGATVIEAGTVQFANAAEITISRDNALTIASGATLLVAEDQSLIVSIADPANGIDNAGYPVNEGTILVDGNLTVGGSNEAILPGTIDVTENGVLDANVTVTVTGTVTVATDGKFSVAGVLNIGEAPEYLGEGTTGAVSGTVTLDGASNNYVMVYAGASAADAVFTNGTSTEPETTAFTVNGIDLVTVYTFESRMGVDSVNGVVGDLEDLDADQKKAANIKWKADGNVITSPIIGDYALLNADIEYAEVSLIVSVGSHITLTVDGVIVSSTSGMPLFDTKIGTHIVSATINPGYSGDITITFNGQTVANGGAIEVTADMIGAGVVLSVSGQLSQDSTVVIDGGSSDDSGMSLTDILLIVLVVLILVMAIIVALRLMRS